MSGAPRARSERARTLLVDGTARECAIADTFASRLRGMYGSARQALLITPCSSVHSMGMRRTLEVAYLSADGTVLVVRTLPPWRMHAPVRGARAVLEAVPGTFAAWGLAVGSQILRDRAR